MIDTHRHKIAVTYEYVEGNWLKEGVLLEIEKLGPDYLVLKEVRLPEDL